MKTKPRFAHVISAVAMLASATFANALELADDRLTATPVKEFSKPVTRFEFSPNSEHLFVAEEEGVVIVYDNLNDSSASMVLNIKDRVNDYLDHGILGMALHPNFPETPWLYLTYSTGNHDGVAPNNARLSRFTVDTSTMTASNSSEVIFLQNWCQGSLSHGIGDIKFGPDGALYITAGDGAKPNGTDIGGRDSCNDPSREGGALRSQDYATTGDTLGFNGTMLRLDPATGEAMPDNPNFGQDENYARVVAYGFRNPFRFTIHPTTNEIFISDVGWNLADEINYIENPIDDNIENFGWPCFEGDSVQGSYRSEETDICNRLYSAANDTKPFYEVSHDIPGSNNKAPGCPTGIDFYLGGNYPSEYHNNLFFADYTRREINVFGLNPDGTINPNNITQIATGEAIVDMHRGPGGDLFYLEYQLEDYLDDNGRVVVPRQFFLKRISAVNTESIVANIQTNHHQGSPGLNVQFNAQNSTHPSGGELTFEWDLDGDGAFDDSTDATPAFSYAAEGVYPISLRATDAGGNWAIANTLIFISGNIPEITIHAPASDLAWATGDTIDFSASAVIPSTQQPASSYHWVEIIHHCAIGDPNNCHTHNREISNQASGTTEAPEHGYPAHLELRVEATGQPGGVQWFDLAWQKRRAVFINNLDRNARNNQALYIQLDESQIDYENAGENGSSLRFVDHNGNVLRHDVGSWNVNGISQLWVEVANVPANSSHHYIWMYYDNPSASNTSTPISRNNQDDIAEVSREYPQRGFTGSASVSIYPLTAELHVDTVPSGLTVAIDSLTYKSPRTETVIQGSPTTVAPYLEDNIHDIIFGFESWDHGGERSQIFSIFNDESVTANYVEIGQILCNVDNVFFRGTANQWRTTPMTIAREDEQGRCIWEVNIEFDDSPNNSFKFDIFGNWSENYGDNNIDGIADRSGENIPVNQGPGNYYITYNSETREYTVTQQPLGPQAPTALAGNDITLRVGSTVNFDGSASFDVDGEIVRYQWTSVAWEGELSGPTPSFAFNEPGEYPVSLTVIDSQGLSASDQLLVTVNPLQEPHAQIDGGNRSVTIGSTITFTSDASNDPDGEITTYLWDNGDTTPSSTRSFNELGEFPVSLSVTDDSELSDSTSIIVTVIEEAFASDYEQVFLRGTFNSWADDTNMMLIADHIWSARVTFATSANENFKFDVFGDWSLNWGSNGGDNIADRSGANIPITEGSGDYDITFNDRTKVFTITKHVGPVGPSANAGADENIRPGDALTFNGSATAGDAEIVSYTWTSSAWEDPLTGPNPNFIFTNEGVFDVTLTVDDANNLTDTDALTVTVAPNQAPVAVINNGEPVVVTVGGTVTLDGSASHDADGSVEGYLWENGDTTVTSTRTYNTIGTFEASLTVTDNEGASSNPAMITVIVEDEPSTVPVAFTCHNGNTVNGQSVYVVGNIPELGNWTVASNQQKLKPNGWPTWQDTLLEMPANAAIDWKCVIADEESLQIIIWEGGDNNFLTTGASGTFSSTGSF